MGRYNLVVFPPTLTIIHLQVYYFSSYLLSGKFNYCYEIIENYSPSHKAVADHSWYQNNINSGIYLYIRDSITEYRWGEWYYSSIKGRDVAPLADLKFKIFVETDKWREYPR